MRVLIGSGYCAYNLIAMVLVPLPYLGDSTGMFVGGVVCPVVPLGFLGGLILLLVPRPSDRRRDAIRKGVCEKCGYSLTGNVSGRCPECGTDVPAVDGVAGLADDEKST